MSKAAEIRARDRAMIDAEIQRRAAEARSRAALARAHFEQARTEAIMHETYKPRSMTARHTAGTR